VAAGQYPHVRDGRSPVQCCPGGSSQIRILLSCRISTSILFGIIVLVDTDTGAGHKYRDNGEDARVVLPLLERKIL